MLIRYRTERAYGSHIRDIKLVLQHEIFDLGNSGILCYIRDIYKNAFDNGALDSINEMISVSDNQADIDAVDEEIFVSDLVDSISEYLGYQLKYALWLADREVVEKFYEAEEGEIDAYEISSCVLCDLGKEGTLYGYCDIPKPIDHKLFGKNTEYFINDKKI